ncbi:DoxX family membrane protein [Ectobacillus ponti]|uniref:DoxX family membrane protein n=1 Tax=Ectobacillus ponti TaxID=2961894 RepID=A0AA41X5S2_9BACI|nr:DoxX family membrane protein [Ectobacillus ponti]MCP8969187.1 DoxX family membrane protein [Ectobacillus ponti]
MMLSRKQLVFLLAGMLMIFSPVWAYAHVKWFTHVAPVKEPIEHILSPLFMGIALLVALVLAVLTQLLPKLMHLPLAKRLDEALAGYRKWSRYILKYGTALALLVQILSGTVFAPEFRVTHTGEMLWVWITIAVLVIPHHAATKVAAALLLALFLYVTSQAGLFHMLDYGFYLAIIWVLFIGKTRLEEWGFPTLYLGTGLSLCWVAVEKWVYPFMTVDIIQTHHVPTFGFPPDMFIVLAAYIEFVVGYLLVVGILNRLLAVVVTILFILTTTIFGYTEVVGHLMIHIILLIFIIEGVSFYYPPIAMHKTRLDQMVFVFLNFIFVLATFLLLYYRFAS